VARPRCPNLLAARAVAACRPPPEDLDAVVQTIVLVSWARAAATSPVWGNHRARDLIDILLVHRLLEKSELVKVRQAYAEIFRLRNKHPWPPSITVLPERPQLYRLVSAFG
jgi:hypothetical protein